MQCGESWEHADWHRNTMNTEQSVGDSRRTQVPSYSWTHYAPRSMLKWWSLFPPLAWKLSQSPGACHVLYRPTNDPTSLWMDQNRSCLHSLHFFSKQNGQALTPVISTYGQISPVYWYWYCDSMLENMLLHAAMETWWQDAEIKLLLCNTYC